MILVAETTTHLGLWTEDWREIFGGCFLEDWKEAGRVILHSSTMQGIEVSITMSYKKNSSSDDSYP